MADIVVTGIFDSAHPGFVPTSGGGATNFLRADGTWAAPGGGSGITDGDYGDVTVSGAGTVLTVDALPEARITGLVADLAAKQTLDATLTALAGLDATSGLVEETALDTFTKRAFGVAAGTSVPTRADADARYAAIAHTHPESDVTNLINDLKTAQLAGALMLMGA